MTYSMVARDPETGQLGVAVQSRWFSVGRTVPWAEAGVGAVATQSFAEAAYGPRGLDLMRNGLSAPEALLALTTVDPGEPRRQVAMVDARGRAAVHTGTSCVAACGHRLADEASAQANMMARDTVWDAMVETFDAAPGELADRLLAALDAAEEEGGDIRGAQSAALLVVPGGKSGSPDADILVDLRVDDHPEPLHELRRLLSVQRGYDALSRATDLAAAGEVDAAVVEAELAAEAAPGDDQIAFWYGLILAGAGRMDGALAQLERAGSAAPDWAGFLARLPAAGVIPDDPALLAGLQAALRKP